MVKLINSIIGQYKKQFLQLGPVLLMFQLMFGTVGLYAQTSSKKAGDITQINQLLKQIHNTEDTSTRAAMVLIKQARALCAEAKIDTLRAKVYNEEGFCNYYDGNYKRASLLFDSTAMLWKRTNDLYYFKALNDKAMSLMFNTDYHKALLVFFDCLGMENKVHNKKLTGQVLNNIGLVYESIEDADNALLYEKKALAYKLAVKDTLSLARTYGNIGDDFVLKEMPDSAIYYETISYRLYAASNDKEGMSNAMGNIGNMYRKKNLLDSAISHLHRALAISQKLNNAENKANFEDDIAADYLDKHDLQNARKYAMLANAYAPQITDQEFLQGHYKLMYSYFKQIGDTKQAFSYLEKLNTVNDSVYKQKINIQNQKVAFQYEYKQKELKDSLVFQAAINASDRKAAASRNSFIISLLLLLLAVSLAMIWYNRVKLLQKQNILVQQNVTMQEQKIKDLENEKQLMASQAVLKGQEDERSRLAKDLHDGLGGLLSGVKHSIINMKEKLVMSSESAAIFAKSLDMIDTATRELRRVAQNMMPEALAKFGLEAALQDYCASACTERIKIAFNSFGEDLNIESSTEIFIYRIIQELVNNAIKHAYATQVMVQLVKGEDWVTISVEDNGKGFDVDYLYTSRGAGWGNIKSRVAYLNGNIDLKSQSGTGTSVNIEVKVPCT